MMKYKKIVLFMLIICSISYGKLEKQFGFNTPEVKEKKDTQFTFIGRTKDIGAILYFKTKNKYNSKSFVSDYWDLFLKQEKIVYFEDDKLVIITEDNEISFVLRKKYSINAYSYTTETGFNDLTNYLRANKNDDYKELIFLKLKADLYKLSEYSDKLNKI